MATTGKFKYEQHQNEDIEYFGNSDSKFFCFKCIEQQTEQRKDLSVARQSLLIKHYQKLAEKMNEVEQNAKERKNQINGIINNNDPWNSTQLRQNFKECYDFLLTPFIKVNEVKDLVQFANLDSYTHLDSKIIQDSKIVLNLQASLQDGQKIGNLLYRGSKDGFEGANFHEKCNNRGKSLTVVRSKETGRIFGGYSDLPWTSANAYQKGSQKSFLFMVQDNKNLLKSKNTSVNHEIYDHASYGPTFGSHALYIINNCNSSNGSYTDLAQGYEQVQGIKHLDNGTKKFTVDEIEVFQVTE